MIIETVDFPLPGHSLGSTGSLIREVPVTSHRVHVGFWMGKLRMWMLVHHSVPEPQVRRLRYQVFQDGDEVPRGWSHIGTAVRAGGGVIGLSPEAYHLFLDTGSHEPPTDATDSAAGTDSPEAP